VLGCDVTGPCGEKDGPTREKKRKEGEREVGRREFGPRELRRKKRWREVGWAKREKRGKEEGLGFFQTPFEI
jgi:hypothetical protein